MLLVKRLKKRVADYLQLENIAISEYFSLGLPLNNNHLIGMEINPQYIKFLKISGENKAYCLDHYGFIPLPPSSFIKNEIKDEAGIANILKNNFQQQAISTKNVVLAINHSATITKSITVNIHLNAEEIEKRVWSEASRLFPSLVGDIFLDYAVLGVSHEDNTLLDVMIVACRKEHIKPYLNVMKLANFQIKAIDVNSYALERGLSLIAPQFPQHKTLALLNIGFSLITFVIIHEQVNIYSYELAYDGSQLMKQIKNDNQAEINEVLNRNLSIHLKHTMQFFYTSRPSIRIEQIILSGDCAAMLPSLLSFVQKETGKATVLANPFKEMKLADHFTEIEIKELMEKAPALVQCSGLALSKIHT